MCRYVRVGAIYDAVWAQPEFRTLHKLLHILQNKARTCFTIWEVDAGGQGVRTWSFVTSNKIPRAKLSMCAFCNLHQLTHVKKRVTDLDLQYCKPLRKDSPGGMLGLMKTLSQNFSTGNYFIRLCLSVRIVVTKMFRYSGDLVCHVLSLRSV